MRDGRLKHLQALERMRGLAEQHAEQRVQEAACTLRAAAQQQSQAHARSDAMVEWKRALSDGPGLPVGLYEQALFAEQTLLSDVHVADRTYDGATAAHRTEIDQLLTANRAVKVVQRRRARADKALAHAREVSAADAGADLWLARRTNADR